MRIFSIKPTLAALCFAAVALGSCYDDKGNYDYTDLPEVVIDTTGTSIRETYALSRYDTLTLEPNVLLDGTRVNDDSSAPLDYTWTLYTAHTGAGVTYITDTIGTKPKLEAQITPVAGTYTVQLTVKNRDTGIERYFKVSCQVEESITAGWMLVYECADASGYSDIGLVVNPLVKKNIDGERTFWDLNKSSNGTHIEGLPKRIIRPIQSLSSGTDPVYCLTDKTLAILNNATFETAGSFEDLFFSAPEVQNVMWLGPGTGSPMAKHVMLNDNKIYTVNFSSGSSNLFGDAKSADYGTLASWTCDTPATTYDAVVYDQTNGCFYCIPLSSVNVIQFGAQDPSAAFDVNNVGMTMLMSDWGRGSRSYSNAYEYSLMQKDSERWLIISNFSTNVSDTRVGIGAYNITESPDIDKATSMAAAYLGEYVLYGAGSKVYNLQYNSSTVAEPVWTAPSSDEEVTCVRLQKYYYFIMSAAGMLPNPNTVVHIATWNEKTKEGKLYQYTIDPASGAISGEPYTYTVPGKVKDMAWKYVMER